MEGNDGCEMEEVGGVAAAISSLTVAIIVQ
jgi:hypothetical protein